MAQTRIRQRLDALYDRFEAESRQPGPDYGDVRLRRAEFNILIDEMLGADYDPDKRSQLLEIEASLRARKSYLDAGLDSGSLDFERYLARLSEMMVDIAHAYEAVLGREDYMKLFGSEPEEAAAIVDSSILSHRTGP
jgi:hypothetical protein